MLPANATKLVMRPSHFHNNPQQQQPQQHYYQHPRYNFDVTATPTPPTPRSQAMLRSSCWCRVAVLFCLIYGAFHFFLLHSFYYLSSPASLSLWAATEAVITQDEESRIVAEIRATRETPVLVLFSQFGEDRRVFIANELLSVRRQRSRRSNKVSDVEWKLFFLMHNDTSASLQRPVAREAASFVVAQHTVIVLSLQHVVSCADLGQMLKQVGPAGLVILLGLNTHSDAAQECESPASIAKAIELQQRTGSQQGKAKANGVVVLWQPDDLQQLISVGGKNLNHSGAVELVVIPPFYHSDVFISEDGRSLLPIGLEEQQEEDDDHHKKERLEKENTNMKEKRLTGMAAAAVRPLTWSYFPEPGYSLPFGNKGNGERQMLAVLKRMPWLFFVGSNSRRNLARDKLNALVRSKFLPIHSTCGSGNDGGPVSASALFLKCRRFYEGLKAGAIPVVVIGGEAAPSVFTSSADGTSFAATFSHLAKMMLAKNLNVTANSTLSVPWITAPNWMEAAATMKKIASDPAILNAVQIGCLEFYSKMVQALRKLALGSSGLNLLNV